jgi:hypothetical protein
MTGGRPRGTLGSRGWDGMEAGRHEMDGDGRDARGIAV